MLSAFTFFRPTPPPPPIHTPQTYHTPGCGKSIALVMAVAWARANNFFVLYVPNAFKLLYDSRFLVRDADGLLDTPDTAKQLLKSMYDAHAMQLKVGGGNRRKGGCGGGWWWWWLVVVKCVWGVGV